MSRAKRIDRKTWNKRMIGSAVALALATTAITAHAGDLERRQAKRVHDRLAGIPATATVLNDMEQLIIDNGGSAEQAALKIMNSDPNVPSDPYRNSAKNFYNVTLKNMVTPWTNEAQTVFAPLNDYTATVIGMIRDEVPFNTVLSANILYVGNPAAYSMSNNNHYEQLEDQAADLSNPTVLQRIQQSDVTNLPATAAAGILTTRAAARAFFIDGTNRAMFRFTLMNHLCTDLEPIKDTSRVPDRVQQDVTRSPGGDSRIFMNSCVGCHAGMDPLNQAFAYYNYVYPDGNEDGGQLVYTENSVQGKFLINPDNFKYGYITQDDSWINYWREGPNSLLGWDTNGLSLPASGNGARSMGTELANTRAFASCQVKKTFKTVCFRDPNNSELNTITDAFIGDSYNMKTVFAKVADACKGI
jgi:hypothetical protein